MCDEYNGWANRETWALALHLGNTESTYDAVREAMRTAVEGLLLDTPDASPQRVLTTAAIALEEWVQELFEPVGSTVPRDTVLMLLDIGSLYRVDYRTVAEHMLDEQYLNPDDNTDTD